MNHSLTTLSLVRFAVAYVFITSGVMKLFSVRTSRSVYRFRAAFSRSAVACYSLFGNNLRDTHFTKSQCKTCSYPLNWYHGRSHLADKAPTAK